MLNHNHMLLDIVHMIKVFKLFLNENLPTEFIDKYHTQTV